MFKFIRASDSIILSRDGRHVLSIVKIFYYYHVCMISPKIRLITKECSVIFIQTSRTFDQEGANMGRPYQKLKTPRIGPLFLAKPAIFFCNYFILFQYYRQERGDGRPLLGCVSPAGCINSGKIHYVVMTSPRHIDNGSDK